MGHFLILEVNLIPLSLQPLPNCINLLLRKTLPMLKSIITFVDCAAHARSESSCTLTGCYPLLSRCIMESDRSLSFSGNPQVTAVSLTLTGCFIWRLLR